MDVKVFLTLDEELVAEAREVAGVPSTSGQLQCDRLAGLLAELEQEHGPLEPQVLEEVRQAWPAPGEQTRADLSGLSRPASARSTR